MFQQIIALLVIAFFLARIFRQRKNNQVSRTEFLFWLVFWFLAAMIIVFIKKIDILVAGLGFSAAGIDVILYLTVAALFYMIFRLRIKLEKIDREITKIVREIAIKK
ncbi:DUF2304 domain-containing protein [Candidatus Parcubacteria bacterium]|nr:DUF2304 domain-containing protein [Candidatus Parcubacteria bacterium]